jgi:hypothetical protein
MNQQPEPLVLTIRTGTPSPVSKSGTHRSLPRDQVLKTGSGGQRHSWVRIPPPPLKPSRRRMVEGNPAQRFLVFAADAVARKGWNLRCAGVLHSRPTDAQTRALLRNRVAWLKFSVFA